MVGGAIPTIALSFLNSYRQNKGAVPVKEHALKARRTKIK